MKKALFFLIIAVALLSCNKETSENESIPFDSLKVHVMKAINDTSISLFDVNEEFKMLIDTMQYHVENSSIYDVRIKDKFLSLLMTSTIMRSDSLYTKSLGIECEHLLSPEEISYFTDSLLVPLHEVQCIWYCDNDTSNFGPHLYQSLVNLNGDVLDVIVLRDMVCLYFPEFAEDPIVYFADTTGRINEDCYFSLENTERVNVENGKLIFATWNKSFIQAMLDNKIMFVKFTYSESQLPFNCILPLDKFHEKYELLQAST